MDYLLKLLLRSRDKLYLAEIQSDEAYSQLKASSGIQSIVIRMTKHVVKSFQQSLCHINKNTKNKIIALIILAVLLILYKMTKKMREKLKEKSQRKLNMIVSSMKKYFVDKIEVLKNDDKMDDKNEINKENKIKTNENIETSDTLANVKLTLSNDEKRDEFFFTLIKSYNKDASVSENENSEIDSFECFYENVDSSLIEEKQIKSSSFE